MTNHISQEEPLKNRRRRLILLAAILVAGALCAWWLAARADREMREDLLARTRLVAGAVNRERVKTLTGTEADLTSPDYLRFKEQLAAMRTANLKYRFINLMGRNADGKVFYFVDSEPAGSKDESPPGQVYEEAPEEYLRVIDTKVSLAVGPYIDRWGTWISALVPLTDPKTNELIAVLGMDIDVRDWKWDVAGHAALPVGLLVLMMIGLAAALTASGRAEASPKPVLRRLLPVLTILLILLFVFAGALLWQQHRERLNERTALVATDVQGDLHKALYLQAQGLATALHTIAMDDRVRQGLQSGDRERLLVDWKPLYETLHKEQGLTHFWFSDAKRVCLLRLHKPEKHGDRFDRFTILEAERTGMTASGIELGPLGIFTLRVVAPVFDGPTLLGYVELGKEIEEVLRMIHADRPGVDLAVVIRKDALKRETWESGMRMLGRKADWDRLPHSVIIYASQGRLPDAFAAFADHDPAGGYDHGATDREIAVDNKVWRFTAMPLKDASGKEVGDLQVMNDITALKDAFNRDMTLGGAAGAILLAALLTMIFVMLRRTDAGIRAQQKALRENEEHLAATLRSIGDGVIACDREGKVASLNRAAEILTGWSSAEAAGRSLEEVFRIIHAQTRETAENPVARALAEGVNVDLANQTALIAKDGTEHQIADSCAPIRDASGAVTGAVLVFRDVTDEYRRREELRESEERHRLLTEHAVSAIAVHEIVLDGAGRPVDYVFRSANPAFEIHTGLNPADVLGRRVTEVLPGIEKTPFIEIYGQVALSGEPASFEQFSEPLGRHYFISAYKIEENRFATVFTDITERKRAEDGLVESEDRFNRAIVGTGAGLWDWDMVKNTVFFSRQWKSMLGYADHEVENGFPGWKNLWHPEDAARIKKAINDYIEGRTTVYEVEHRLRHKDGSWHWILTRGDIERDAAGKPVRWTGTNIDITVRKRAEEALREQRDFSESLIETAQAIILVLDTQGRITRFNPYMEELVGYDLDEVKGMDWFETFLTPEIDRTIKPLFQKAVADIHTSGNVNPIIAKDGRTILVEWYNKTLKDKDGCTVGVLAIGQDITERKLMEDALRESEMRFRFLVDHSYDLIWKLNADGVFSYVSPAWKARLGYESSYLLGKAFHPFVHPDDVAACENYMSRVLEARTALPGPEYRVRHADGTWLWHEAGMTPVYAQDGSSMYFVGVSRDITTRKLADQEKEKLEGQLRQAQKVEAIGTLAGGIAHDFNNILSAIIGNTEILNFADDISASTRAGLDQILAASKRATHLVRQILAFSRHGKQEKILLDLKPIVMETLSFLRASMPAYIRLQHYLEPTVGTIMADPTQMQQILMNLCVNAAHAMEKDGGVLQIKLSNTVLTEEDVRLDPEVEPGNFVKVTVSDTGHGMQPSVLERIFDPYFTTKEPGKGTGLGLAVVHGIVKSHRGMIHVYSEVGKGTTFTAFLPRAMGFKKVEDKPLQPLVRGTEKILFVDDEKALADLGQQMLGGLGYQVETRTSPIEAIEAFRANPQKFDLVITDMTMPQMSGLNLARKIMEIRSDMPIILCTGYSEQANEQAAGAMGIRAFLYKPVVMRDIADAVRKVLNPNMSDMQ